MSIDALIVELVLNLTLCWNGKLEKWHLMWFWN